MTGTRQAEVSTRSARESQPGFFHSVGLPYPALPEHFEYIKLFTPHSHRATQTPSSSSIYRQGKRGAEK